MPLGVKKTMIAREVAGVCSDKGYSLNIHDALFDTRRDGSAQPRHVGIFPTDRMMCTLEGDG